ncbi:hypothetical protein V8F20_012068 [Naviculisporaceae sp. PSN 640]
MVVLALIGLAAVITLCMDVIDRMIELFKRIKPAVEGVLRQARSFMLAAKNMKQLNLQDSRTWRGLTSQLNTLQYKEIMIQQGQMTMYREAVQWEEQMAAKLTPEPEPEPERCVVM